MSSNALFAGNNSGLMPNRHRTFQESRRSGNALSPVGAIREFNSRIMHNPPVIEKSCVRISRRAAVLTALCGGVPLIAAIAYYLQGRVRS